jgi:hypothetical protein
MTKEPRSINAINEDMAWASTDKERAKLSRESKEAMEWIAERHLQDRNIPEYQRAIGYIHQAKY